MPITDPLTPLERELIDGHKAQNNSVVTELQENRKAHGTEHKLTRSAINRQTWVMVIALLIIGAVAGARFRFAGFGMEFSTLEEPATAKAEALPPMSAAAATLDPTPEELEAGTGSKDGE